MGGTLAVVVLLVRCWSRGLGFRAVRVCGVGVVGVVGCRVRCWVLRGQSSPGVAGVSSCGRGWAVRSGRWVLRWWGVLAGRVLLVV